MVDKTREIALKILYKIDVEDAYSNIALDEMINKNRNVLNERDIGLISEIVYGVTTWRLTLDEIVKKYSNIRLKKISSWILNILRMGIYQIVFLDKIPKSAAVNESVNLAKRYGHKSSSNFVNAILRKVDKCDYEEFFTIKDDVERISKTTSIPVWIIEKLLEQRNFENKQKHMDENQKNIENKQEDFKDNLKNIQDKKENIESKDRILKEVQEICENSNIKPKISIRVNKLKIDKNELKNKFKEKNINVTDGVIEDFLILEQTKNIENLDLFKKGFFTIQDEAAGLVPLILNANSNENVLDACSAPGGKTTYVAEIMKNKGNIEAWDIYEHRVNLINKNANRLGISIINTNVKDATKLEEEYLAKFDKILLDVPCLGLGVLKRKPDIKWKRNKEQIQEIKKIQEEILQNCSKYLKNGGELVYSTCSILKSENEEVINEFLNKNANFEIEKLNLSKYKYFQKFLKDERFLQVYQNEVTDGFFICKLRKKCN